MNRKILQNTFWVLLIAFLLSAVVSIIYLIHEDKKVANRIYPNVYINNVYVGSKTKEEAKAQFKNINDQLAGIKVDVLYKKEQIATFSAEQLKLKVNIDEIVDRTYLIGRSTHKPSRLEQKFMALTKLRKYDFNTHVIYDKDEIKQFTSTLEESYNQPARDALFSFENGKVVNFKPHENGLKINSEQFKKDLETSINQLNGNIKNKKVTLTDKILEPEITLAEANDLGIEELIGEGKSDYSHSIPGRIHNVQHAAKQFNGVIVPKGEEFSFNKYVGDISAEGGYQQAYVIKNGKTVLGDGGGVCQISTTVFRAALNTGLPITERHAHAYRVSYYENDSKPGLDATIYTPSVDFKFKNDTPASILIQTEVDEENMLVYFRFYGKKDDRKVEISPVTLWDIVAAPPAVMQEDPTLPRGVTKQVDYSAIGTKARFTYKVTKDGKMEEKQFTSIYRPWAAVYLVGTM